MNKKQCFLILSEFLVQVEDKYKLRRGEYRMRFYVNPNMTVCFSIICLDKVKLKTEADVFLYIKHSRIITSNFDFKINQFLLFYIDSNLNKYTTLKISEQIKTLADALNEIYLDQAIIPIQLL